MKNHRKPTVRDCWWAEEPKLVVSFEAIARLYVCTVSTGCVCVCVYVYVCMCAVPMGCLCVCVPVSVCVLYLWGVCVHACVAVLYLWGGCQGWGWALPQALGLRGASLWRRDVEEQQAEVSWTGLWIRGGGFGVMQLSGE